MVGIYLSMHDTLDSMYLPLNAWYPRWSVSTSQCIILYTVGIYLWVYDTLDGRYLPLSAWYPRDIYLSVYYIYIWSSNGAYNYMYWSNIIILFYWYNCDILFSECMPCTCKKERTCIGIACCSIPFVNKICLRLKLKLPLSAWYPRRSVSTSPCMIR